MKSYVVGVDLGGTNLRAAVFTSDGAIRSREQVPTQEWEGPECVIERIKHVIRASLEQAGVGLSDVAGIGLGSPGPLDPWKGIVHEAPNLTGWVEVPLKDIIERHFGISAFVGNDANAAALGEFRFGAGKGTRHMVYMTISTGIGGGIIADGRLFQGKGGAAGEIGHMTIDVNGPRCNCGNIGCLEALASGPAIARRALARVDAGEPSALLDEAGGRRDDVTAVTVVAAARRGDRMAQKVMHESGVYIGVGIINLIHVLDTELFVLGGGVSRAGELLFEPIRETVQRYALPSMRRGVRIIPTALGDDVGLYGAAALVPAGTE